MKGIVNLFKRLFFALVTGFCLSMLGISGNVSVLETVFTVLGIVFSISMSLIVSFSLNGVLNKTTRKRIVENLNNIRTCLLRDFCMATLVLVAALVWNKDNINYYFSNSELCWCDVCLWALCIITYSLAYEILNFSHIHELRLDLDNEILKEESSRKASIVT